MARIGVFATTGLIVTVMPPVAAQQSTSPGDELKDAEASVAASPQDGFARQRLIELYKRAGRGVDAENQALWLAENQPDKSEALGATFMVVAGDARPSQRLNAMWRRNTERYPSNTSILFAAARVARIYGEYVRAESLLRQGLAFEPNLPGAQEELAGLYSHALLTSAGVRRPAIQAEPEFLDAARKLAEEGTEMPLVGLVGELIMPVISIEPAPKETIATVNKSNAARTKYAEMLLRRAGELDRANPRWNKSLDRLQRLKAAGLVKVGEVPAARLVAKRITVEGNVQASKLVKSAEPTYPPLAQQARVEGTVQFEVLIARTGIVAQTRLLSGHPLLVQAAQDALQQYEYEPTIVGGEAVEVVTKVDISFRLGPPDQVR